LSLFSSLYTSSHSFSHKNLNTTFQKTSICASSVNKSKTSHSNSIYKFVSFSHKGASINISLSKILGFFALASSKVIKTS